MEPRRAAQHILAIDPQDVSRVGEHVEQGMSPGGDKIEPLAECEKMGIQRFGATVPDYGLLQKFPNGIRKTLAHYGVFCDLFQESRSIPA